jgi:hypothetical protein
MASLPPLQLVQPPFEVIPLTIIKYNTNTYPRMTCTYLTLY